MIHPLFPDLGRQAAFLGLQKVLAIRTLYVLIKRLGFKCWTFRLEHAHTIGAFEIAFLSYPQWYAFIARTLLRIAIHLISYNSGGSIQRREAAGSSMCGWVDFVVEPQRNRYFESEIDIQGKTTI